MTAFVSESLGNLLCEAAYQRLFHSGRREHTADRMVISTLFRQMSGFSYARRTEFPVIDAHR